MKKIINILSIITAFALLCLCGCAEETVEVSNFERPVINLCSSIEHNDSATYLNCFTPAAKKAYLSEQSSSGSSDIVQTVVQNSGLQNDQKIDCEIISKRELSGEDRDKLQRQYRSDYAKNVTIEKAFQLDAALASSKGTAMRKFTVVLIDNSWYIYGEVIEKIKF